MASIWQEAKYSLRILQELVFPRHCAVCNVIITNGYVCDACRPEYLLRKQEDFLPREEYLAGACEAEICDVVKSILYLYKYDGVIKEALHRVKFANEAALLPFLREEIELALPNPKLRWLSQFDLITCVPTVAERRKKRGFDVPEELFGALLDDRGETVYRTDVLRRTRSTAPLYELDAQERRAELMGCFALHPRVDVGGKSILLCDDIYTTGSTLTEAALALRKAGASEVHALTFTAAREHW